MGTASTKRAIIGIKKILFLVLALGVMIGCEGPSGTEGPEGPKGEQGPQGPVGPAGEDGTDGEDGSQIHSGSGAPSASLGVKGDYYLDKSSYELYGPKTGIRWGTPINLKGADGNANVTRYLYPAHNFSSNPVFVAQYHSLSEMEMKQSVCHVYLVFNVSSEIYYSVPGLGRNINYSVEHNFVNGTGFVRVLTEPNKNRNNI